MIELLLQWKVLDETQLLWKERSVHEHFSETKANEIVVCPVHEPPAQGRQAGKRSQFFHGSVGCC